MPVDTLAPPAFGRWTVNPSAARFLRTHGIVSAADALALRGEIVCGHPDRHVARVELDDRVVFVKREHLVGVRTRVRNWRAGFGLVSRGEREATTLRRLAATGLPAPGWLAHGTHAGRAVLLVDGVPDAADLPATLADSGLSPADRRALAERLGRELADTHAAGFGTPELAAKHVLVGRRSHAVTLLDWQSAPQPGPVPVAARVRQLATLHATLAGDADRLRLLWAYRRVWGDDAPRFGDLVRAIAYEAGRLGRRSSVRDQRRPAGPHLRLVWLAGEAVCVRPELVDDWPDPADGAPFYGTPTVGEDYNEAVLVRWHTFDPLGRLRAALRERPWRSPAAKAARHLFHLERFALPGPRLLAFGQKLTGRAMAESFVLHTRPGGMTVGITAEVATTIAGQWVVRHAPDWPAFAGDGWLDNVMTADVPDREHRKQGRAIGRWTLTAPDGRQLVVYLKRHFELPRRHGWLARLLPGRAWSPGLQEWDNLQRAAAAGLPVPRAVAAGEWRGPGGRLQSFLAVEELADQWPLHEAIRWRPDGCRRSRSTAGSAA